ncbi:unnamed protein product [Ceratitis capitata]|uniref:(Mediterranean fruit fly) hypothetical protein n=1 Tax=Ceratitis capitata TaxID=7213 RepID=A0A811U3V7_CERCA|nr:unnamed protein product [Ceratitis capitata]
MPNKHIKTLSTTFAADAAWARLSIASCHSLSCHSLQVIQSARTQRGDQQTTLSPRKGLKAVWVSPT